VTRILIISRAQGLVAWTWKFWAQVTRWFWKAIILSGSPDSLKETLGALDQGQDAVQIWAHGAKGYVEIGHGQGLSLAQFKDLLKDIINRDGLLWIRTCETGLDEEGMQKLSIDLDARVLAYRRKIGPIQAGLVGYDKGQKIKFSRTWNTCLALNPPRTAR